MRLLSACRACALRTTGATRLLAALAAALILGGLPRAAAQEVAGEAIGNDS